MDSRSATAGSIHGFQRTLPILLAILVCLAGSLSSQTQQAILVSGSDRSLGVFDLATGASIATVHAGAGGYSSLVAVGSNPRLAVQASQQGAYPLSVIDLTIQREIARIPVAAQSASVAFTSDGRFLLVVEPSGWILDVFDAATFRLLRRVSLLKALGGAQRYAVNPLVTAGRKAYVIPPPSSGKNVLAEVDLGTFRVRPITLPAGNAYFNSGVVPEAALTPDGRYLIFLANVSGQNLLRVVDTSSRKLAFDTILSNNMYLLGLVINPNGANPANVYGYVLSGQYPSAILTAIDLRPNSQTFGQLVSGTDVPFPVQNPNNPQALGLAISGDGSRVVVSGQQNSPNGPMPNVFVVDTSAMLAQQGANSIVASATAAGGAPTSGIAVASVVVTPPQSAPTVTQVSKNVTNDASTLIDVFGTNFSPGATVRLGSFGPLATSFVSASDLKVTVPQNAPAGKALDVIVTNPKPHSPLLLQNQSGLLAGGITIFPNPLFQPHHEFVTLDADYSIEVYDSVVRTMSRFQSTPPRANSNIMFNFDGSELYSTSYGPLYYQANGEIDQWRMSDISVQASIPIIQPQNIGFLPTTTSQNPFTGSGHVMYVPDASFNWPMSDVEINMIDVDPSSPTFNTILSHIPAGLNAQYTFFFDNQIASTPDGKFVYLTYDGNGTLDLAIFDVLHQTVTSVDLKTFGADQYQGPIQITADGKWLLIHSFYAGYLGSGIVVLDISSPNNPTLAATVNGSLPNSTRPMYFWSFQVVGNLLFAADSSSNAVLTFNFDPANKNFSQLGTYFIPGEPGGIGLAVTPDGALVYVDGGRDSTISVLDANALANGQPALITKLATSGPMQQVAVSPISTFGPVQAGPSRQRSGERPSPAHSRPTRPSMVD